MNTLLEQWPAIHRSILAALGLAMLTAPLTGAVAQGIEADQLADALLAPKESVPEESLSGPVSVPILELMQEGGWLMVPIALMSLVVATVAIERFLALRRSRILPRKLEAALRRQAELGDLDPPFVYSLCKQRPCSASRVVLATLAKLGRPHAEVEAAAAEATEREANRMYGNVRTLNLAAAVTPLMGLLGTVWGMIRAFFVTANLEEGIAKAPALAEGIYVALMTTFAGLAIAIPAAVMAHYFEGRILRSLRDVESLMSELLPRIENCECRDRIDLRELEAERLGVPSTDASDTTLSWRPSHTGPPTPHRRQDAPATEGLG